MDEARRFTDRDGFSWQVCELSLSRRPTSRGRDALADAATADAGELYFFARGTTLVLRDYPREWSDLSARELEQLRAAARILGIDATTPIPRQALAAAGGASTGGAAFARSMTAR